MESARTDRDGCRSKSSTTRSISHVMRLLHNNDRHLRLHRQAVDGCQRLLERHPSVLLPSRLTVVRLAKMRKRRKRREGCSTFNSHWATGDQFSSVDEWTLELERVAYFIFVRTYIQHILFAPLFLSFCLSSFFSLSCFLCGSVSCLIFSFHIPQSLMASPAI